MSVRDNSAIMFGYQLRDLEEDLKDANTDRTSMMMQDVDRDAVLALARHYGFTVEFRDIPSSLGDAIGDRVKGLIHVHCERQEFHPIALA